jgi:hypothetical protein
MHSVGEADMSAITFEIMKDVNNPGNVEEEVDKLQYLVHRVTDSVVLAVQLGTPRGRYDEHSSKSSFSMKLRFIEPVGE